MTNDAKLGLVVGVGLVIVVAVVFFRKEIAPVKPANEANAALTSNAPPEPGAGHRGQTRTLKARTANRSPAGVNHTVQEGETLFGLAQHYYGDGNQYVEIYRVNRGVLLSPEHLDAGTVLFIPELPAAPEAHRVQKVKR